MSRVKIFKKVLIPCAAGVTNVANEGHTFGPNCVKKADHGTKPSDLPIYSKECIICREASQAQTPTSSMEETVGNIRKELWVWQDNLKGYRHKIVDVYRKGFSKADCPEKSNKRSHLDESFDEKVNQPQSCLDAKKSFRSPWSAPQKFEKICLDRCGRPCSGEHKHHKQCQEKPQPPKAQLIHSQQNQSHLCEHKNKPPPCEGSFNKDYSVIDYLRAPTHGPHRVGAILLSGLAGYIMAMRRGRLRRLFYGTFGILGMAAICYPEEASEALESVILEGRRYFIVAYHFIYGESPKPPEWLEKFTGPLGPKEEGKGESNETTLDLKKTTPSEKD